MYEISEQEGPIAGPGDDTADDRAVSWLTAAFEVDPPVRWMYPGRADYLAHFPTFLRAFGGVAIRDKTLEIGEGGAAL